MNEPLSRRRALLSLAGLVSAAALACQRGAAMARHAPDGQPVSPPATPNPSAPSPAAAVAAPSGGWPPVNDRVTLTDAAWRARLNEEQFEVLRHAATERAFSGQYWDHHAPGLYLCAGCENPLFASNTKFDSGTGWPSFFRPYEDGRVRPIDDSSHGMRRTEVRCARCDGHLGHVFDDGPAPTGLRYCINSASLRFRAAG